MFVKSLLLGLALLALELLSNLKRIMCHLFCFKLGRGLEVESIPSLLMEYQLILELVGFIAMARKILLDLL